MGGRGRPPHWLRMMRTPPTAAVVAALALAAASRAFTQDSAASAGPRPIVEQMVTAFMRRSGTHAVAVSLYFEGREYLLSFGDDGGFPAQPVTPDLIFGIGSVTKVFTATMLAYQAIGENGNPPLKRIDDCVCD